MAKILIIDDDEKIIDLLMVPLEKAGHKITAAPDGLKGLAHMSLDPADIIITDIVMPDVEGIEIIRKLRRDYPDKEIIAISGYNINYLEAAAKLGAYQTFRKPFDVDEIVCCVNAILEEKPSPPE